MTDGWKGKAAVGKAMASGISALITTYEPPRSVFLGMIAVCWMLRQLQDILSSRSCIPVLREPLDFRTVVTT